MSLESGGNIDDEAGDIVSDRLVGTGRGERGDQFDEPGLTPLRWHPALHCRQGGYDGWTSTREGLEHCQGQTFEKRWQDEDIAHLKEFRDNFWWLRAQVKN
jgi:hypothetical protein